MFLRPPKSQLGDYFESEYKMTDIWHHLPHDKVKPLLSCPALPCPEEEFVGYAVLCYCSCVEFGLDGESVILLLLMLLWLVWFVKL